MNQTTTPWGAEAAYAELKARRASLENLVQTSNEAETRLHLIDSILFDILDWEKGDVEVEKFCRAVGFADYVFTAATVPALIIEAKRLGTAFTIPEAKIRPEPVAFGLLDQESAEAGDAMRQVTGYAAGLGVRYVAISNGSQWVLALTYVQGQQIQDRQVIVFDSISSIEENFRKFWNCFSKAAIAANEAYPLLLETRKKPAPAKLSATIPGYPVPSNRNKFVNELDYILNTVWDILSRTENTATFLKECYVAPRTNEQLIAFASDVLKRRVAADRLISDGDVSAAEPADLKTAIIGYQNEKPFVILGEVGHGKTTFLSYLRLVAATELLDNYLQIEADFLDRPDAVSEVTDFIYSQVEAQLLNRYSIDVFDDALVHGALHGELQRFKRSSMYKLGAIDEANARRLESEFIATQLQDRHSYFAALIRHLKHGRGKSVAFFFDNLDRRTPEIQEAAFLKASSIARDWECVVFVCLRPATFYESLKRGLLDSLAPRTFTVGSPDLALVLKRRFRFAGKLAMGEIDTPILRDAVRNKDFSFRLPSVAEFFGCCEFSARKGASAIEMLGAMSNGNIRYMLELTKRMLVSGHLDTGKILAHIREQGDYYVPDFEAVKTLLYGDYDQYDPKSSVFLNLFDIYHSDQKEHFIRILTLEYLIRFREAGDVSDPVPYTNLLGYLESFYFDVATVQRHLAVLAQGGCIDAGVGADKDTLIGTTVRITERGSYHLNSLAIDFTYLDAMTIDTPITDHKIRAEIKETVRIQERLTRTDAFLKYLSSCVPFLSDVEGQKLCNDMIEKSRENWSVVDERVRAWAGERS